MKKLLRIGLVVVAVVYGLKYMAFDLSTVPDDASFNFDIQAVSGQAATDQKLLPVELRSLTVAEGMFPAGAIVAGDSLFTKRPMVFAAFQVVYADGTTVIIDSAHDQTIHDEDFGDNPFYPQAFKRLQQAMLAADMIIFTHEHRDHVGGLARSPILNQLTDNVLFTREQVEGPTMVKAGFPPGALKKFSTLSYKKYYNPSPGIVLVKAPGHSTGTQLIYVELQNGHRFLFVGDIAWNLDNITRQIGKPWAISQLMLGEDQSRVWGQLKRLKDVAARGDIHLVVSHDAERLQGFHGTGLIQKGFIEQK